MMPDEAMQSGAASRSASSSSSSADRSSRKHYTPRLYDEEGSMLLDPEEMANRITLLPCGNPRVATPGEAWIRLMWGQNLLADLLAGRYRTLVCAVNPEDNTLGILAQLSELLPASQWNAERITTYAKMFAQSIHGDEELVLKYDLDTIEVLALLRPPARDHFTLEDLRHGFRVVSDMLDRRRDRSPCASVAFLGAKTNRIRDKKNEEPTFETVLRIMYEEGFRGDVYPSLGMWELESTGFFATYPFPESLDRMRAGGF